MTPDEMRAICTRQDPLSGEPAEYVMLTIPRNQMPSGRRIRLTGHGGPYGEFVTVNPLPGGAVNVVGRFKCAQVLKWLNEQERLLHDE